MVKELEFKFPFKLRGRVGDKVYCAGPKKAFIRRYVQINQDCTLSDGESRTRGVFAEAVVSWNNFYLQDKQLYRDFSVVSTKGYFTGWNLFVKDYIKLRKDFEKEKAQKIIQKFFEIWKYVVWNWKTNAYKDFSFNLAIENVKNEQKQA